MSFSVDLVNLVLYCIQQLGVMLGVGAATVILIVYFFSIRDGVIEAKEEQFGRTVHRVLVWGLWLIVISGVAITLVHIFTGSSAVVLYPAFMLKWFLIGGVLAADIMRRKRAFVDYKWEGLIAANWYALFAIHTLAPIATWLDLLILYGVWIVGFMACYIAGVHMMRAQAIPTSRNAIASVAPEPKKTVLAPKPEPIKIIAPTLAPKPAPSPMPKPVPPPPPPAPKPIPPPPKPVPLPPIAHPMPPVPMMVTRAPVVATPSAIANVAMPNKPPATVPQKPAPSPLKPVLAGRDMDPNTAPSLPAVHVMPRSKEEVDNHYLTKPVQSSK